jgi:hypothetical protein
VDKENGSVYSFFKVNNATLGRFFNASKKDLNNHEEVVDLIHLDCVLDQLSKKIDMRVEIWPENSSPL